MSNPYTPLRHGESEYNSICRIPSTNVPEGASGSKTGDYFARMVHLASVSDIINIATNINGDLDATNTTVISGEALTISNTVVNLADEITLDDNTTTVRISFSSGGDCCVTYDGTTPVAGSVGEMWYPGGILKLNKTIASGLKLIRNGTTDVVLYITQLGVNNA
jgi:hypothetical protein